MNTHLSNPLDADAARKAAVAVGSVLGDELGESIHAHRVESLLSDIIPNNPTEKRLLMAAYRDGATRELCGALCSPHPTDITDSLVTRLTGQHYSEAGARFAVTAWTQAIGARNLGAAVKKQSGRWKRVVSFLLFGIVTLGVSVCTVAVLVEEEESDWYSESSSAVASYAPPAASLPEEQAPADRIRSGHVDSNTSPPSPPGDPPPTPVEGGGRWRLLEIDGRREQRAFPLYRMTLDRAGYVSFPKPSKSAFVLTSDEQPRPVPEGMKLVAGPTRRTVHHQNAKCHISCGTMEDIWFAWFYETTGAWLVDAHHASEATGQLTHRVFLYRLADESWWSLDDDPTQTQTQSFLEGLSATPPQNVVAKTHGFVKRYHLAGRDDAYFKSFFERSLPLIADAASVTR